MGNPLGLLLSFFVPLVMVDQQSDDKEKIKTQILWMMVVEGAPSVILAILTLLFWFKGKSRETVMVLEGHIERGTIVEEGF